MTVDLASLEPASVAWFILKTILWLWTFVVVGFLGLAAVVVAALVLISSVLEKKLVKPSSGFRFSYKRGWDKN